MLDIVLEYLKLSKVCFIIGETFGSLGLYVIVKGIISSFIEGFGYRKISSGISLALIWLSSISNFGIFVLAMFSFSSLKHFSFPFPFSTMVHFLLARGNGIFIKQSHGWFDKLF